MKNEMTTKNKILIAIALIALAVITRFMPHLWNFTALTAVALFAGNYLGPRYVVGVVFLTMLISDLFIGFYDWKLMATVYGSFALVGFIPSLIGKVGSARKQKTKLLQNSSKVLGMSLLGSVIFFLVTNWAVWFFGTMYPASFSGLVSSYAAGLPFFRNAVLGNLWYTGFFFGVYEYSLYLKVKLASSEKFSKKFARN
jgi:membrane-associated HD superfamily phosphohydrolase